MRKRSLGALLILTAVTSAALLIQGLADRAEAWFNASRARPAQHRRVGPRNAGTNHLELVKWENATLYQLSVDSGVLKPGKYHLGVEKSNVCIPLTGELEISADLVFEKGDLLKLIKVGPPASEAILGLWDGVSEQVGYSDKTDNLEDYWIRFNKDGTYESRRHGVVDAGKYKIQSDKLIFYQEEEQLQHPESYLFAFFSVGEGSLTLGLPQYPMTAVYSRERDHE